MTRPGPTQPFAPTIRGIGCVSGYGWGREVLRSGMRSGMSSIAPVSGTDERLPEKVWGSWIPEGGHLEDGTSRYGRALRFSAREAVRDAREHGWVPGDNVGLIHCVVLGEVDLWKDFYLKAGGDLRVRQYLQLMPSTPLSLFMQEQDFHGPVMSVQAMCSSGAAGMLTARNWLQTGWASDVIIVATDISGTPENIVHFHRLGVGFCHGPSEEICKPFQKDSRGFMLGEASVGFVLSERGDTGYARVRGGAMTHDGFHVTSVEPSHEHVRRAFERGFASAGIGADDVAYVAAHGPGTLQCDTAEQAMLEEFCTDRAGIYSVKPLIGHCQGAAAAIELAAVALSHESRMITAAPRVGIPTTSQLVNGREEHRGGVTVKSSLGMGGHNAVVVLDDAV